MTTMTTAKPNNNKRRSGPFTGRSPKGTADVGQEYKPNKESAENHDHKNIDRTKEQIPIANSVLKDFGLGCDQLRTVATHTPSQLLDMIQALVPPLERSLHKGQAGRVAVIGGCQEYTGAPYFAAITALKVGADLSHVFCTAGASPVIKSYSPELIVHPVLDSVNAVSDMSVWLPRFHSLVVGPGLGREKGILETVESIICKAKEQNLPIVIDADGLHLITNNPSIISGYKHAILTPNVAEFSRLYSKVVGDTVDEEDPVGCLLQLCQKMGNVTIVKKGRTDVISNGDQVMVCSEPGSPRRCGGQGDLLSGSMGTFYFWAQKRCSLQPEKSLMTLYGPAMCAAYSACVLTRESSRLAFAEKGRTMTATDLLPQLQQAFENLFH